MVTHIMGTLIKMNRIQQNMSQRALCEGICVPSYLSKIESGEIIATSELINLLFDVLGIRYNDSVEFIEAGDKLFRKYLERLTFNDFKESNKLFLEIEQNKEQYIHSPLIIDYYLIKLARYCSTEERVFFEEPDKLLTQVYSQMNANQKLLYNLYKAIDLLQLTEDYEGAMRYLKEGLKSGENGHIYYWMSTTYLYQGHILKAYEYGKKAMQVYLNDANVISMMCTYELIARIYMANEDYEVAKEYFRKSVQIGLKTHETYFQSYVYHKMAWCHLCIGEIEEAMECIKKDQFPKGLMMKLEPEEVQAIIAYEKDDEKMSYHLIEKVSKEAHLKDKPIFKFLKACVEESYDLQKVDVAPYLLEIIEENHKKVDILPYFKRLLVKYYKENRKYKEAVMLLEKK